MPKNYYIVLGIPTNSTHSDIKSAYRRLAKEYHPDYHGQSPSPFQAIQEAYSVLSDPSQRKQYDDSLEALRAQRKGDYHAKARPAFHKSGVEPLVPEQHQAEPLSPDVSSMSRTMESGFDSLLNQFINTASSNWDFDTVSTKYGDMEVLVTQEQAQRGGHIRVHLPARIHCPSCQGWARSGLRECWRCYGTGYLRGEVPILLHYPPGIFDNHVVEFSLYRYGFSGNLLKVRFRVAYVPCSKD